MRIEIEGRPPSAEALWATASGFGHFTAMQVRGGGTRGLELHLARLEAANQELFGSGLDGDSVREFVRHALGDLVDASVRVYVFESADKPVVMVTVKEPAELATPQRLQSVEYQRPDAHLKHLATGQGHYSRLARRNGFEDALLVSTDGRISETATANVAFLDDDGVIWPEGRFLHGITMQLLKRALPEAGVPIATRAGPACRYAVLPWRVRLECPWRRARLRDRLAVRRDRPDASADRRRGVRIAPLGSALGALGAHGGASYTKWIGRYAPAIRQRRTPMNRDTAIGLLDPPHGAPERASARAPVAVTKRTARRRDSCLVALFVST